MLEMTFEEATAMIKLDAERTGEKRGEKRGKREAKLETAHNLLELGIDINVIMKATNLTEKQIRQFQ